MKVKDLITLLQQHSPDAEVVISDADTDWELPVYVSEGTHGAYRQQGRDGVVYLWGDYADRGEHERRRAAGAK